MSSLVRPATRLGLQSPSIRTAAQRHLTSTSTTKSSTTSSQQVDIDDLLSKPTWSVSSLLPKSPDSAPAEVTSKQLRHLLKLSALPPPSSPSEEAKMLQTLSSQLHFVKEIQKADTAGVKPLQSLRDETAEGERAAELGLEALREALEAEEVRGKFHRRIRRKREESSGKEGAEWNVLGTAGRKTGRFFVVDGGKGA
ncbi:hypothetical protein WHR41_01903 [Cladosporium halotolerans]|uniref:Glutamyl-tRNA amidotransferase complex subunit Gta3 domain-containing protein n=1 Tax=Cladosporium halotolerans TaxID=1052096 RepID=A0AB34L0Q4_9PEZI